MKPRRAHGRRVWRHRLRAFAATLLAAGCTPRASTIVQAPADAASVDTPPPRAEVPPPAPELRTFAWDRVLVIGWGAMGGPGLASVAKIGERLSVMVGDGPPMLARVDDVNRDGCDDGGPPETCLYVAVEYGSESDPLDPESLPALWQKPGFAEDEVLDDVALLDARLAVAADTALPRFVPHTLEVRYANALCEGDADSKDYVLLRTSSSAGDDPVKDVPALRDWRRYPRRVVTLRAVDRTLHFVAISKVSRPRSKRMSDIPPKYETAFWILEDVGTEMKVLHHERQEDHRNINLDISCQLPLRYPIPWNLVESEGVVHVLTRSSITSFERWSLQPDGLTREGGWIADVNQLG